MITDEITDNHPIDICSELYTDGQTVFGFFANQTVKLGDSQLFGKAKLFAIARAHDVHYLTI